MTRASDHVYKQLRELINSGQLVQGAKLTEEEAAQLCEVSRTPVRDALRRMEREMLVIRRGASYFVRGWTQDDIDAMFELRSLLEGLAAQKAARTIQRHEIESLESINEQFLDLLDENADIDAIRFHEINYRFHELICKAGMQEQYRFIAPLLEEAILYRSVSNLTEEVVRRAHEQHRYLIRALSHGDPELAANAIRTHIRLGYYDYRKLSRMTDAAKPAD